MDKVTHKSGEGSRFVVELGGLKLPQETEKQIELGIRQLILNEVAKLDLNGSMTFDMPDGDGGTSGMVLRFVERQRR